MICVVDASVAVKWFVAGDWARREDDLKPALALLQASANGQVDLLQPPHFLAEVAAVLARLSPASAQRDIANLAELEITWAHATGSWPRAVELACTLNHHLFDTLYHALALDTPGAVLITADRRYFDKAQHLGQITRLSDFGMA